MFPKTCSEVLKEVADKVQKRAQVNFRNWKEVIKYNFT